LATIAPTQPAGERTFHLSISPYALEADPDLVFAGTTSRFVYGSRRVGGTLTHVRLPQLTRIAGMKRKTTRTENGTGQPDAGSERSDASPTTALAAAAAAESRWEPPGWNAGTFPLTARFAFKLPTGLEDLRLKRLRLVADIDVDQFECTIGVRQPGTKQKFVAVVTFTGTQGRLERNIEPLIQFLGPNGELPEFEVKINKPAGPRGPAVGRWDIRELDVEIWGIRKAEKRDS